MPLASELQVDHPTFWPIQTKISPRIAYGGQLNIGVAFDSFQNIHVRTYKFAIGDLLGAIERLPTLW